MKVLLAALVLVATAGGIALGTVVVPSRGADVRPAAVHRVELRALYGPTGSLVDLRRIETWRFRDRERRSETALRTGASTETIRANGRITMWNGAPRPVVVRDRGGAAADDVDRRAARLRAALELGWMERVHELEVGDRRAVVLRARRSSPIEPGRTVAVDPDSFTPLAGEHRAAGRVVERRRLLVDERVAPPSLLRARSVPPGDPHHNRRRSTMTNRTRVTRALAALAAVGALAGTDAATAPAAPARAPIHHWVIEHKTMAGKVGRTEGWERGGERRVLDDDPGGPGFSWCGFGPEPQEWRIRGDHVILCGRKLGGSVTGLPPGQMLNPAELGQVERRFIDHGAFDAAGEEVIDGRRVTVWREADRPGFGPEEERKGILSTVYLDAVDGRFVERRDDSVASGKTQEMRVLVDEVLPATRARLVRAGLARR